MAHSVQTKECIFISIDVMKPVFKQVKEVASNLTISMAFYTVPKFNTGSRFNV